MNAIDRYQEVLDTMIVGNRTGIYLSKEELQDLLDYVKASEEWLTFARVSADSGPGVAIVAKWREARKKLGLTEGLTEPSPSE